MVKEVKKDNFATKQGEHIGLILHGDDTKW